MALYRFTVTFEDYDDISRVIDIQSSQSFLELHKAILDSIKFDQKHMASFYLSNDQWHKGDEITLENMLTKEELKNPEIKKIPIMKKSFLNDFIEDPHQKFLYVYDFLEMWSFHVELTGIIMKEEPKTSYPVLVRSEGVAPKQYSDKKFVVVEDEEFEDLKEGFLGEHLDVGEGVDDDTLVDGEEETEDSELGVDEQGLDDSI